MLWGERAQVDNAGSLGILDRSLKIEPPCQAPVCFSLIFAIIEMARRRETSPLVGCSTGRDGGVVMVVVGGCKVFVHVGITWDARGPQSINPHKTNLLRYLVSDADTYLPG